MLAVDPRAATPPYEQLRTQLLARIRSGELPEGSRLPTVRRLAEDLGLAPNTVARTYRELESDGLIETRGRGGTFVRAQGDPAAQEAQEAARTYAEQVRRLGIDPADALRYVRAALQA
jgi:DNA-binding transcriptional regulator YhcF (GntR family)